MKLIKYLSILVLVSALVGCGHGYKGKWIGKVETANKHVSGLMGTVELTIGSDYMESDGERLKFDKIFERKTDGDKYLVFKGKKGKDDAELAWKILDKNTLLDTSTGLKMKYERVK